MYVMHLSTMTMLLLLAQMSNRDGGTGMKTMLRDINVIPNGAGQGIPYASSWSSTYESFGPLRTFHSFFHHLSHHPMTLAVVPLWWCLGFLVWVFCLFCVHSAKLIVPYFGSFKIETLPVEVSSQAFSIKTVYGSFQQINRNNFELSSFDVVTTFELQVVICHSWFPFCFCVFHVCTCLTHTST